MEEKELPFYVHGMGRRRLSPPKEKITEEKKKEIIEEYACPCHPSTYEKIENKKTKDTVINFQI